ncbi:MAG: hypothetical protein KAS32_12560 [Candidatus Peribacteraceae bacterium]|nr:hypothetical protein [Candidatus Peribacteraceae bacterium]
MDKRLKELLSTIMGGAGEEDCCRKDRVVVSTIPMRPEWKVLDDEFEAVSAKGEALAKEMDTIQNKMKSLKSAFWTTIEKDLDDYGTPMRHNSKTNEIEVLGDKPDEEVPLPNKAE